MEIQFLRKVPAIHFDNPYRATGVQTCTAIIKKCGEGLMKVPHAIYVSASLHYARWFIPLFFLNS